MLSAFTLAFLFTPYFEQDSMFALVVLGGVAIGSLIIDIDGSDSAVMHSHIKGIRGNVGALINGLIAPILPIFGYITKYTIYKPSLWILSKTILIKYNKEEIEHHRGFSHSIIGVLSFAFVTGAYLLIICLLLDILNWLYFMSFILAYIFGAFMHMLEDSCTKSGIQWNSPFSKKLLKGEITTNAEPINTMKPNLFSGFLGFSIIALYFLIELKYLVLSWYFLIPLMIIYLIISWIIFLKYVAKITVLQEGKIVNYPETISKF